MRSVCFWARAGAKPAAKRAPPASTQSVAFRSIEDLPAFVVVAGAMRGPRIDHKPSGKSPGVQPAAAGIAAQKPSNETEAVPAATASAQAVAEASVAEDLFIILQHLLIILE